MDSCINSNSRRCKRYREKKRLLDPDYSRRESERHKNYRQRSKEKDRVLYGSGNQMTSSQLLTNKAGINSADADPILDEILDRNYDLEAPYVVLQHPFTMFIAGPTGSGKTYFVSRLLKSIDQMIQPNIQEILWYHGQHQQFHHQLQASYPEMKIINGLPDSDEFDPN